MHVVKILGHNEVAYCKNSTLILH